MSRITITLPNDLIDELIDVSPARSRTEAVVTAIKDEIRNKKKERIKGLAGKIEFVKGAEDLRHADRRLGKGPR
jgi:metal-responsive CopG/Arc/MetJ family transcriptional regulator